MDKFIQDASVTRCDSSATPQPGWPLSAHDSALPSTNLDSDLDTFATELRMACDIVVRFHRRLADARVTPASTQPEIAATFDEPLPQSPQAIEAILGEVESRVFANSTFYQSPRFYGYINGSGSHAGILAELLSATVNQLCAKWHFAPAAAEVERRVIRWLAEFIGYVPNAAGCLLSGGSAGNLVGLALSRASAGVSDVHRRGLASLPPMTVYVSHEGHASLDRAMGLLGLGRDQLRRIQVRDDFTIDVDALANHVATDRAAGFQPIAVVGNAGTTNTGAVDPLHSLADFCRREGLWFHVDAAYGGPAARTSVAGTLFQGLDRADSVVVNAHKWLHVPAEASCILVKDARMLSDTFRMSADYLREESGDAGAGAIDFKDLGPQLSRSFRALKVWVTFKAYGTERLRDVVESNVRIMRHLADRIDASDDFVRLAPVPLSVVCFQYRPPHARGRDDPSYLDDLNHRLCDALERDGRVFLSATKIHGRRVLRACSINHRLTKADADFLLDVVRDVGGRLVRSG